MPLPQSQHRRVLRIRGFSLVELLTVIAIIGILAAILIPVVGRMRENARASACASNLRQIAAGALLYANDNKGRLMPIKDGTTGETWRIKIEPYLGSRRDKASVLICPSDPITDYPTSSGTGEWPASYGFNAAHQFTGNGTLLEYNPNTRSQMRAAINQPARLIMVTDIGRNMGGSGGDPATWVEDRTSSSASLGYARFPWGGIFNLEWSVWGRHGGGRKANAAFYDGSVRMVDLIADLKNHPNGDPLCLFDNH